MTDLLQTFRAHKGSHLFVDRPDAVESDRAESGVRTDSNSEQWTDKQSEDAVEHPHEASADVADHCLKVQN